MTKVTIKTSSVFCRANQWIGFYMKGFRHEKVYLMNVSICWISLQNLWHFHKSYVNDFFKQFHNQQHCCIIVTILYWHDNTEKWLQHFVATCDATNPTCNYMFKVNSRNNRAMCEICSKLTMKTPERAIGVALASLLLTLNIFHNLFKSFYCKLWAGKCWLLRDGRT